MQFNILGLTYDKYCACAWGQVNETQPLPSMTLKFTWETQGHSFLPKEEKGSSGL